MPREISKGRKPGPGAPSRKKGKRSAPASSAAPNAKTRTPAVTSALCIRPPQRGVEKANATGVRPDVRELFLRAQKVHDALQFFALVLEVLSVFGATQKPHGHRV